MFFSYATVLDGGEIVLVEFERRDQCVEIVIALQFGGFEEHTRRIKSALRVVDRPGDVGATPPPGWRWNRIEAPLVSLSSSLLRERIDEGKPVDYLVPRAALAVYNRWRAAASTSPASGNPTTS